MYSDALTVIMWGAACCPKCYAITRLSLIIRPNKTTSVYFLTMLKKLSWSNVSQSLWTCSFLGFFSPSLKVLLQMTQPDLRIFLRIEKCCIVFAFTYLHSKRERERETDRDSEKRREQKRERDSERKKEREFFQLKYKKTDCQNFLCKSIIIIVVIVIIIIIIKNDRK